MLGIVYFQKSKGVMPTNSDTAIKVATSAGTVVGQLGFGALADIVGRKKMYGLELILIIFATLAQALTSNSPSMNIVGVIIFWRVLMVIVVGTEKSEWLIVSRALVSEETILFLLLSRLSLLRRSGEVLCK